MTIRSLCNSVLPVTTAETTLYTSATNTAGVVVTKFVAHNDSNAAAMYAVKIYGPSGSPVHIQPMRLVNRKKADIPASVAGSVIPPGGRLVVEVSIAGSISFTVAGDA